MSGGTWSLLLMVLVLSGTISCAKNDCAPADATCQTASEPPPPPPLTEPRLTVSTTSDVTNGDTRDPAHLVASPGSDGISLREALLAISHTGTPFEVTFDASMVGKTIALDSPLPTISRDGTVLLGLNGPDNSPGITLSGARMSFTQVPILPIVASNVRVARLRFTDVVEGMSAIRIVAGDWSVLSVNPPGGVTNVRIEESRFDNAPRTTTAYAVVLSTAREARSARIANVTIARNSFNYFKGDGSTVMLLNNGQNDVIENVDMHDNQFSECIWCIELVNSNGLANTIQDTRIVRNFFATSNTPITLGNSVSVGPAITRHTITRTLVSENRFVAGRRGAALGIAAGYLGAAENTVSALWFLNNIVANHPGGLLLVAGDGANNNRIDNIRIAHSTFYSVTRPLFVSANEPNTSGNVATNVTAVNSIFWNSGDPTTENVQQHVFNSIIRLAGSNGNFNADPLFVAPDAGDFRLQAGSPAIDKGIAQCPVATDFLCASRVGPPDLGAIEFGATQTSCGNTLPQFPAPCTLSLASKSLLSALVRPTRCFPLASP